MNAQEAIKRIENRLASLEFKKKELAYPMTEEEKYVFLMDIEALSIVLESAKLLHESEPEVTTYQNTRFLLVPIEVSPVDDEMLKKIGINGGADE